MIVQFEVTDTSNTTKNRCNRMSIMSEVVHDCFEEHVFSVPTADDGVIVTALQIEERIKAHCSAREYVTACVKGQFWRCLNVYSILRAINGRYSICSEDKPSPWITEWINTNHKAILTEECGRTIHAALGENAFNCTEHKWTVDIDWRNTSVNVLISDTQRYMSHKFICIKNMVKIQDSDIYMQGACNHLGRLSNLLTMSALYINSGTSPAFLTYFSEEEIVEVEENARGN